MILGLEFIRRITIAARVVQTHPVVHYLLPLPDEQLHQLPHFPGWVLAQAIHMPADVRVLESLVGDVHVRQVLQQTHQLVLQLVGVLQEVPDR
uniref:Uncharacterized protein n=1 Tax=Arundo donax TaxID=35708 RepID=A0A0A9CVH2_ARUDO